MKVEDKKAKEYLMEWEKNRSIFTIRPELYLYLEDSLEDRSITDLSFEEIDVKNKEFIKQKYEHLCRCCLSQEELDSLTHKLYTLENMIASEGTEWHAGGVYYEGYQKCSTEIDDMEAEIKQIQDTLQYNDYVLETMRNILEDYKDLTDEIKKEEEEPEYGE